MNHMHMVLLIWIITAIPHVLNGQTQYAVMLSEYNEIYSRYMFMHCSFNLCTGFSLSKVLQYYIALLFQSQSGAFGMLQTEVTALCK